MLMVISFPVPHADGSVNSNHKKGACPSGHGPFFVYNRWKDGSGKVSKSRVDADYADDADYRIHLIFTNSLRYTYE